MSILNSNGEFLFSVSIDSRGFNIIRNSHNVPKNDKYSEIRKWIFDEFDKMKKSNPLYGTYSDNNRNHSAEGKKKLIKD